MSSVAYSPDLMRYQNRHRFWYQTGLGINQTWPIHFKQFLHHCWFKIPIFVASGAQSVTVDRRLSFEHRVGSLKRNNVVLFIPKSSTRWGSCNIDFKVVKIKAMASDRYAVLTYVYKWAEVSKSVSGEKRLDLHICTRYHVNDFGKLHVARSC